METVDLKSGPHVSFLIQILDRVEHIQQILNVHRQPSSINVLIKN